MIYVLKTIMALGLLIVSSIAIAIPISGSINFSGLASYEFSGDQVTKIIFNDTAPLDPKVLSSSGSFASINPGTVVSVPNNPFILANIPSVLWSVGGFTFELTSINYNQVNPVGPGYSAGVSGSGFITKAGYETTGGIWGFTSQTGVGPFGSTEFSFSSTTVPEPATIALLGIALFGFGLIRNQKSQQKNKI